MKLEYLAGSDIQSSCEDMYHKSFNCGDILFTKFNGVLIIMLNTEFKE